MRVVVEVIPHDPRSPQPFAWPVDTLGNATVPRVGDDVVLPDANLVVASVTWNPLGDPDGWPERDVAAGEPFVLVMLRPWGLS